MACRVINDRLLQPHLPLFQRADKSNQTAQVLTSFSILRHFRNAIPDDNHFSTSIPRIMSGTVFAIQQWSCTGLLSVDETSTECNPFALIILNQPVTRPDILQRLWHTAGVKICADGGGNRVHDTFQSFRVAPEEETRDVRES